MIEAPQDTLDGRVILITGASRGLGREMALELARTGAILALAGARASAALEAVGKEIPEAMTLVADVGDAAAAARAVADVEDRFGKVDVLINNAGLGMRRISETFNTVPTRFWESEPQAWAEILTTNVAGPFNMARAAVPGMVERGYGKVINISTSAQTMVRKGYSPYGPSKAALEAATRVWAQDLEGTGVTANAYLPGGAADTDLLPPSPDKKGADGNLLPASIMRRGIVWLCSNASDGVNGARFIARKWDTDLEPDDAAQAARDPGVTHPAIM